VGATRVGRRLFGSVRWKWSGPPTPNKPSQGIARYGRGRANPRAEELTGQRDRRRRMGDFAMMQERHDLAAERSPVRT
jgi:hypothetical protein